MLDVWKRCTISFACHFVHETWETYTCVTQALYLTTICKRSALEYDGVKLSLTNTDG